MTGPADDRAADEARMLAIFGRRRRSGAKQEAKPAARAPSRRLTPTPTSKSKPKPETPVEFNGLTDGPMGLIDINAELAWEASLGTADQERWKKLKDALSDVGPEMRWRAAGWVMRTELEYARKCYRVAKNMNNEPFKAELIRMNGLALREAIEGLEQRLAPVYAYTVPLANIIGDVDSAFKRLTGNRRMLKRVCGAWVDSWPGAERGRGVSGYDTAEGIQRHQQSVKVAHERYRREQDAKGESRRPKGGQRTKRASFSSEPTGQVTITKPG